jgi:uncharacterized protein
VLLLLPPSEGKAQPQAGPPADLGALAHAAALGPRREELLDRLTALCAGDAEAARAALGLSPGQAGDIARNARLREAPAAPARAVYTGVLYARAGAEALGGPAADRHVLIASALWGVLRPGDRIPAYRLSMGARLPGLGGLAAFWRPALAEALGDGERFGLVVDLRSGAYAAAWRPAGATLLAVRAFTEGPGGERRVVSHMAKAARGDVARALLAAPAPAGTPQDAAAAAAAAGLRVELGGAGRRRTLDVIG